MPQSLVTVAIPTVDRLAYLQEAVASALQQKYPFIEVLISDDGNLTALGEWATKLQQDDPRVRYLPTTQRLGLAANWNRCLQEAKGEYLIIIGDDDRLLPNTVLRMMEKIGEAEVLFANHFLIDSQGGRLLAETETFTRDSGRSQLSEGILTDPELAIWKNSLPISSALLKISRVKSLGFRQELNTPEIDLYLRLASLGGTFVFCSEFLIEYRVHSGSATSKGLWTHRIAPVLIAHPASAKAEPEKRRLLESLMPNAVGRAMECGERGLAQELWQSSYYPDSKRWELVGIIQFLSLRLPTRLGGALYRFLGKLKNR